jgi:hypothetical protein
MDSFEHVIASILERQGYWTRTAVKVELSPAEKAAIGRRSSPRWELDIVGYRGRDNHILVLECKSYLWSKGVQAGTFAGKNQDDETRYKMFFDRKLRKVVLGRLVKQLVHQGFCAPNPRVSFGLAAGKVHGDETWLRKYFRKQRWELWTPSRIRDELTSLRDSKYENSVAAVVAKLILRGIAENDAPAEAGVEG